MIPLRSTDTLRVTTSSANALDVTADYHDSNASTFSPDRQLTAIASIATTPVVTAPSSGLTRTVKELAINAKGGSNTVIVDVFDGTTAYRQIKATLSQDDSLLYEDGDWAVITDGAKKTIGNLNGVDVQTFKVAGTYTWMKPSNPRSVDVYVFPVGGPGGSGRKQVTAGTAAGGGGGGSPGTPRIMRGFDATLLGATETVTIGAESVGGTAQTANDTNGNNGTVGGTTSFGSWISAPAGNAGSGGTTVGGNAGGASAGFEGSLPLSIAGTGGSTNGTATSGTDTNTNLPTQAGGGGGINASGAAQSGGRGGNNAFLNGGTAGTAGGTLSGTNGATMSAGNNAIGGTGGGGGAGGTGGAAGGTGGDGGFPSGAGAGGGGSIGGGNSGAAGKGGSALVIVITHCGS